MVPSIFSQSLSALSLPEAIVAASELGVPAIELMCWQPHFDLSTARARSREVADWISEAGLRVSALSLSNVFTDPAQRAEQLRAAELYMRLARSFGTNLLKLTPGPPASAAAQDARWDAFGAALRELIPMAKSHGLRLAFETHMRQLTDTLAGAQRLLEVADSDAVGLTVDLCNLAFAGEDLSHAISVLGPHILHVHVKNGFLGEDGSWDFRALDEGLVNYPEVLRALAASGYGGYLSVECLGPEAAATPRATAARDVAILKGWL